MRDGLSNGSKDEKSYKTVIRTVKQYSSRPIDSEDFRELCGIAEDYQKLKRIVYERYGGIGGLSKISTRNVVQRELLDSGIRKELQLPSIYFQMAVKEAVSDIEAEWTLEKQRIQTVASNNPGLSGEEIHYLRFLLKVEQLFSAVNQRRELELPERFKLVYGEISDGVDTQKLDNYIRGLTRKYHKRISAEKKMAFH